MSLFLPIFVHGLHDFGRLLLLLLGLLRHPLVADYVMVSWARKPRGTNHGPENKTHLFTYDAFHHVLLEIWINLVFSFWRRNSAAMVPQSAPPGLHPLVRARMMGSALVLWQPLVNLCSELASL